MAIHIWGRTHALTRNRTAHTHTHARAEVEPQAVLVLPDGATNLHLQRGIIASKDELRRWWRSDRKVSTPKHSNWIQFSAREYNLPLHSALRAAPASRVYVKVGVGCEEEDFVQVAQDALSHK